MLPLDILNILIHYMALYYIFLLSILFLFFKAQVKLIYKINANTQTKPIFLCPCILQTSWQD